MSRASIGRIGHALRESFRGFPFAAPGTAAALFGVVLLLPGDTFGTSRSFAALASLATEDTWGLIFAAVGMLNLLSLSLVPRFAWVATMPVLIAFAFLATVIAIASWPIVSTGTTTYAVFAVSAFWAIAERVE